MAVKLSPIGNDAPFLDASGIPLNGGLLYTYTAGSVSTPETTYTTSLGSVQNANPIVLNSNGYPASGGNVVEIWLTSGVSYKFVLKTSTGVTVWSRDNIDGINDTSVTIDQWVSGPAPTYVGATSFTLVGDQTTTFHVGRRLKTTNSGGTIYSTIISSAFAALTTITVANDSSTLDSGLSAISYGLISYTNTSINADMVNVKGSVVTAAATTDIWSIAGNYVHVGGSTGISSFGTAPKAGARRTIIHDAAITITHGANLKCPGDQDLAVTANTVYDVLADTTTAHRIVNVTHAFSRPAQFGRMFISGLTYANNSGDATNDIDVAAGTCRDATDAMDMVLASTVTKQSDVAWAVGTGNGGLDTGAVGNSDYYIWLIKRSDTGVVDALYSLSSTAPTMPTNYDYKRLIGFVKRVGGTIVAFHSYETEGGGLEFNWDAPTLDVNQANALTTSRRTDPVKVPLNFSTIANLTVTIIDAGTNVFARVMCPDETDAAVSVNNANFFVTNTATTGAVGQMLVRTSSAGLVAARADTATVDAYRVETTGFRWARRN